MTLELQLSDGSHRVDFEATWLLLSVSKGGWQTYSTSSSMSFVREEESTL